MKAYSLEFRQKIVDTYLLGGISQRQLADKFCVSLGLIEKLNYELRTTNYELFKASV
ncbi:hypothetical protein [Nostoc sp. MS1]|uniref:hypothetical protein n=1 Tax=Nostoc sp. MS1 TaxID=2764711 RepID=UPI001CC64668|nr:hypothetical protein [Nostoc sp. MS1]BCL33559.1 hypothetical protein NSMS1_00060 [Nostoc sp. MS1]